MLTFSDQTLFRRVPGRPALRTGGGGDDAGPREELPPV